jgi:L-amino acid N-acyltransferase YncA
VAELAVLPMTEADWPEVSEVYAAGIATGHATFEATVPAWPTFAAGKVEDLTLVARDGSGRVLGCVWSSRVSPREVYAGVVEESVYVDPAAAGSGVGRALLTALVEAAEAAGVWTIQAQIFPENDASMRLHAALGFRVVGTRERIGRMQHGPLAGQWRDVVLLERRSDTAEP